MWTFQVHYASMFFNMGVTMDGSDHGFGFHQKWWPRICNRLWGLPLFLDTHVFMVSMCCVSVCSGASSFSVAQKVCVGQIQGCGRAFGEPSAGVKVVEKR